MVKNYVDSKGICQELLILTYGSFVNQLVKDTPDIDEVNRTLFDIGHNMGVRLIEDFASKNININCSDFTETADAIAKNAFKTYLNVTPTITNWNTSKTEFSLLFDHNPLAEYVELPAHLQKLYYSNILAGIIKGALEMVYLDVDVKFVKDQLQGDAQTELRLSFIKKYPTTVPDGE